jgi:hypothetical protein
MPSRVQLTRIVLLSVALIAMLLLAMGISQLELVPGVPFAQIWQFLLEQLAGGRGRQTGFAPLVDNADALVRVLQMLFLVALIIFPFAVIIIMLDPDLRKRVLRSAIVMLLLLALASMWASNLAELTEEDVDIFTGLQGEGEALGEASSFTDEEFSVESIPTWLPLSLSLGAGLIIAIIVVSVVRQIRRDRAERVGSLTAVARRAEAAIDELEQGGDLQNTIMRCYAEMTRIVGEQRGIRRGSAVTAGEFTDFLVRANLPPSAVRRLTQLFERARYGTGRAAPQDEADAIASLQAIVDACRSAA